MGLRGICNSLKKKNIFGDYILAARYNNFTLKNIDEWVYKDIYNLINYTLDWDCSPQGYDFWYNVYTNKFK